MTAQPNFAAALGTLRGLARAAVPHERQHWREMCWALLSDWYRHKASARNAEERTPLQAAAARCFDRAFTHRVACTYLRGVWPCDCGVLAAGGDGPSPPERLAVRQSLR